MTKAGNTAGQTINPIAYWIEFQTYWNSFSKGLDGPIPVISHPTLSLGTSSPCMHAPWQISQCFRSIHTLWS